MPCTSSSSSSFLITTFLFLSFAPYPISSTRTASSRRILHQPFFPQDSLPPSQPPSPSPPSSASPSSTTSPKIPFSNTTPDQSPFFPNYPSPPPPPSPTTFASFPANISSLILPQSPKPKSSSTKLLAVAISSVISAVLLLGIIVFYHRRHKRLRGFTNDDAKTYRSDNSNRLHANNAANADNSVRSTRTGRKLRTTTSASSEFLYLGTLVNSQSISEDPNTQHRNPSPELRPLPPLNRQSLGSGDRDVGSTADEDEEEFYSPRGSVGGRESSIGTGSASRRTFAAVGADGFDERTTDSSSCSSSTSASPARSNSLSISPPASSSPRPKSPESGPVVAAPSSPSPPRPLEQPLVAHSHSASSSASSPDESPRISFSLEQVQNLVESESHSERNGGVSPQKVDDLDRNVLSPTLSPARVPNFLDQKTSSPSLTSVSASPDRLSNDLDRNVRSPSLSSASASPNRGFEQSPSPDEVFGRNPSPNRNVQSSLLSSACSSPERGLEHPLASPRMPNVSDQHKMSPLLSSVDSSPDRDLKGSPDPSPDVVFEKIPSSNRNVQSSLLSSACSSPERSLEHPLTPPRMSNVSDQHKMSPLLSSIASSPDRGLKDSPNASPGITLSVLGLNARISTVLEQPISVPPPPPPPPPPLPPQRQWESAVASTPTGQPISRPPALVPPSRPFVLNNPTAVSPIELPPSSKAVENVEETIKPKLKPLHWDKVRASSDREMVWDQLRSSSFKLNEEMIETLFVVNTPDPKPKQTTPRLVIPSPNQENRVLDPKKAQNIAILLRALNVTIEEVCEALVEGNADMLGTELLESLLKMAPSKEEERKLKEYKDDSPTKLGHAEKFLKAVLDVPFAFKRVDAMLYMSNFESEVEYLKKSFETLEAACEELRNSRMFLKLLEAVLKTGNRMNVGTNRGDAHAFKLDTLLKLVDVKGADGKTTLLHFVVQEIIRTEGARLSAGNQTPNLNSSDDAKCRKLGLQVVSGLSSELTNVKKAAAMDSDVLSTDVAKLSRGIENISEVLRLNETMGSDESRRMFSESMNRFTKLAEEEIIRIQAQESVAMSLVKEITEYFHGNSAKEEAHPFRIFMVVRDFLGVLDRVCKEVGMINERTMVSSAHKFPVPVNPTLHQVFPGPNARRQCSSSDNESSSP